MILSRSNRVDVFVNIKHGPGEEVRLYVRRRSGDTQERIGPPPAGQFFDYLTVILMENHYISQVYGPAFMTDIAN